ncbi:hypothetical protein GLV94_05170 [Virgibacillus halodenitrificans]|uniref:hypothetical protein n=1 Tax=Virgibacillus halodenitrificans TaxID=1482 RepID=UPI00136FB4E4|nr:hypothetical protein [Virgibacillus halodenitrificans]MYL45025.1 hypothetical protein [Virgibacillus halodenitrificans]
MIIADYEQEQLKAYYIEQLHKLGFSDTDGLEVKELRQKLALQRYLATEDNGWF